MEERTHPDTGVREWLTESAPCLLQVAFIDLLLFGAIHSRGFLALIRVRGAELRPLPFDMAGDDSFVTQAQQQCDHQQLV